MLQDLGLRTLLGRLALLGGGAFDSVALGDCVGGVGFLPLFGLFVPLTTYAHFGLSLSLMRGWLPSGLWETVSCWVTSNDPSICSSRYG